MILPTRLAKIDPAHAARIEDGRHARWALERAHRVHLLAQDAIFDRYRGGRSASSDCSNTCECPDCTSPRARARDLLRYVRPAPARESIVDSRTGEVVPRARLRLIAGTDADAAARRPAAAGPAEPPLDNDAKSASALADAQLRRARMYRLQEMSAALMPSHRVCHCIRTRAGGAVDVRRDASGRAFLGGLQTCGSVWDCPVCASKITESRRTDVQSAVDKVRASGAHVSFLTLTVPHSRHNNLRDLKRNISAAYRYLVSGRFALSTLLDEFGYIGTIRAFEITHGDNGWHPHYHVLIFTAMPIDISRMTEIIFERWCAACKKHNFSEPNAAAFKLDAAISAGDIDPVTNYLVKWGVAEELSKLHTKKSKSGSTPWQLLEMASNGDKRAGFLFQEYSEVFKGARQLVWSHGLRLICGLEEEMSDQEIAESETVEYEVLHVLGRVEWTLVRSVGSRSKLLDIAENKGRAGILDYLSALASMSYDCFLPPDIPIDMAR